MLLILTSTGHWLFSFINKLTMTLNDLKPTKRGFDKYFAFLAATHISRVNCAEMARERPRQPAYEIFKIKRKF